MPLKGTTDVEDDYVSQDELWEEWDDGSVLIYLEAHTEFTYCLDSTERNIWKEKGSE